MIGAYALNNLRIKPVCIKCVSNQNKCSYAKKINHYKTRIKIIVNDIIHESILSNVLFLR